MLTMSLEDTRVPKKSCSEGLGELLVGEKIADRVHRQEGTQEYLRALRVQYRDQIPNRSATDQDFQNPETFVSVQTFRIFEVGIDFRRDKQLRSLISLWTIRNTARTFSFIRPKADP